MREILFRGKRKDNGEWIEGIYSPLGWDFFDAREENAYIIAISDNERYDGFWFTVDNETVGQFTGTTDRNGKKIFEGDIILDTRDNKIWEIAYLEKYMRFAPRKPGVVFAVFSMDKVEVIGNIHDNPELMKGDKE